jgi:microcystin-dependent protein
MGKKISQLPDAAPLNGDEDFPCVQGGQTTKATVSAVLAITGLGVCPPGSMLPFAGPVPAGWLACDGAEYPTADHPTLSAYLMGRFDTFRGQAAPAAGNFRVPLISGLAIAAAGAAGLNPATAARSIGDVAGEEAHDLALSELTNHGHFFPIHSSSISGLPGNTNLQGTASPTDENFFDANVGGGMEFNIIQPTVYMLWGIKT